MTTVARDEFMEKYGQVKVQFKSYYKYAFTYSAELPDNRTLEVQVGGDPDEIYRMSVTASGSESVVCLGPFSGTVYENGQVVESFEDYGY